MLGVVTAATVVAAVAVGEPAVSNPGAANAPLSGRLRAPGGPFLTDRFGRVVFLHGVNVVFKHPPFEVYPAPHRPWNFGPADARRIQRLGFDVVRLGIIWQGLEPGTLGPNSPQVCTPGAPRNPHQLNRAILLRYLDRVRETVQLLAAHHIYTLIDMHQDVYSQVLGGEGAPRWAVCTDGVPPTRPPGRWSKVYGTRAADIAFAHFWANDVVGNLQGQFDEVWGMVAQFFRHDPWVLGFDPFNEPFALTTAPVHDERFDAQLQCFYAGTAHVGRPLHGAPRIRCPASDPRTGVIPTILRHDPKALIFDEPDLYASRGLPTFLGPMNFPNLVFNVHIYCSDRNPRTGNPDNVARCVREDTRSLTRRREDRAEMSSRAQPRGPAWFVSEWGATSDSAFLRRVAAAMDAALVGWTYWSWKYYNDPTGSADEALVRATGRLRRSARVLSRTYAQAVAGVPLSMSFDVATGRFSLRYRAARRSRAPTLIAVPTSEHYAHGYCVRVVGGRVVSAPDSPDLVVTNGRGRRPAVVTVVVRAARRSREVDGQRLPVCSGVPSP